MPAYEARKAGTYRATFTGTDEREMRNPESGQLEPRWVWKFQDVTDPTSAGQLDKITGTSLKSPQGNARQLAVGLIGNDAVNAGINTDTAIGRVYDVEYGPNRAGNLAIVRVTPVKETVPTTVAAEPTTEDALPF